MTDRHAAYLVTLDHGIREDDAEEIITALKMIKHVIKVEPVPDDQTVGIAMSRRDVKWRKALYKLGEEGPGNDHIGPTGR